MDKSLKTYFSPYTREGLDKGSEHALRMSGVAHYEPREGFFPFEQFTRDEP